MPDALSPDTAADDTLAPGASAAPAPMRLAMANKPPEVPPSGSFPAGKTAPARMLLPTAEPQVPGAMGGAPRSSPRQQQAPPRQAAVLAPAVKNAAQIISARQGGISTVHIADIKALLRDSGLSPEQVDAAILAEARAGRATLAKTSSVKITDAQKTGGLDVGGDYYHTVTFK